MLKIIYHPTLGAAVPDGRLEQTVADIIRRYHLDNDKNIYLTSSELLIDAFRVAVVEGQINCKDIVFSYNNEEDIRVDNYGTLSDYPQGFLETHNGLLFRLIKFRADARKATSKEKEQKSAELGSNSLPPE